MYVCDCVCVRIHTEILMGEKSSNIWDLFQIIGEGGVNVATDEAGLAMSQWLLGLGYGFMGRIVLFYCCICSKFSILKSKNEK